MKKPDIVWRIFKKNAQSQTYSMTLMTPDGGKLNLGDWDSAPDQHSIHEQLKTLTSNHYHGVDKTLGAVDFGKRLYLRLPDRAQDVLWQHRNDGFSLQIYFDPQLWLPWEWCYLIKNGQDSGFLCRHYIMAQWPIGKAKAAPHFVFTQGYRVEYEGDADDEAEARPIYLLEDDVTTRYPKMPAKRFKFGGAFEHPIDSWLMLVESFDEADTKTYGFLFGEGYRFIPSDLEGHELNPGEHRPLVIFMNCMSGQVQTDLFGIHGWPDTFIKAGAGGMVCTYFLISSMAACEFTNVFEHHFYKKGCTLGEATQKARFAIESATDTPQTPLYGDVCATYQADLRKAKKTVAISWQESLQTKLTRENLIYAAIAAPVLLILCGLLGWKAHESRTDFLDMQPLNYDTTTYISTGLTLLLYSKTFALISLFSSHIYLASLSWLSLILLCLTTIKKARDYIKDHIVTFNVFLLLFSLMGCIILLTGLEMQLVQLGEGLAQAHPSNLMVIWTQTTKLWLLSDAAEASWNRTAFVGSYCLFLLAISFARFHSKGPKSIYVWLMRSFNLVILSALVWHLPKAYAYSNWGLKYKQVAIVANEETVFPFPVDLQNCCIFDASEGSKNLAFIFVCKDESKDWVIARKFSNYFIEVTNRPVSIYSRICKE